MRYRVGQLVMIRNGDGTVGQLDAGCGVVLRRYYGHPQDASPVPLLKEIYDVLVMGRIETRVDGDWIITVQDHLDAGRDRTPRMIKEK